MRAERLAARSRAITFFVFLHLPFGLFSLFHPLVLDEVIIFLFCLWFYFFGDLCTARRAQTAGSSFLLGSAAAVGAFTIYSSYYFLSKFRDLYLFLDCTCSYIRNVILLEGKESKKKRKSGELKSKTNGHGFTIILSQPCGYWMKSCTPKHPFWVFR